MRNLAYLAALFALTVGVAQSGPMDPKTIVVSGYAEMQVKPDYATVNIGVVTSDKVTTKALQANSALMHRVVDAIKALGIADSAMQTSDFSIAAQHPVQKEGYGYDFSITLGYVVSNFLTVSLNDLGKVAEIIDAAVKAGANTSNSVTFDAKQRKAYEDKVLADAVKDARHNAEVMAAAEGAHIGKMISMANTEGPQDFRGVTHNHAPALAMESVVIMPGEVPVSAQVTVVYAVE